MRLEKDKKLIEILKITAPGTQLREGLDNILRAKTGGLIILGDSEEILEIVDGGFNIDSEYSSSYIYELAKMDGAIVLSSDLKRILYANTQLIPQASIPTFETGTRHRTAHRVTKQTGCIVIAISQRSEEHTSELQSRQYLVCRLLLEKKKHTHKMTLINSINFHTSYYCF